MAMDKEWERYHGGPTAPTETRMHAAISPQGQIFINKNLYRVIGRPEAVYIYFNRGRQQIALESASSRLPQAFPIKEAQNGYRLQVAPFLRHHGIRLSDRLKFVRPDIAPGGQLVLDLTHTVVANGAKRKRKS